MLLKFCAIILILSLRNILGCVAEETTKGNTAGTGATDKDMIKSPTNVADETKEEAVKKTNDLDNVNINSSTKSVEEPTQGETTTNANDLDKATVNSPTTVEKQTKEESTTITNDLDNDNINSPKTTVKEESIEEDTTDTDSSTNIEVKTAKVKSNDRLKLNERRRFTDHNITTNDGYILTIFRLAPQVSGDLKRHAVLLVHGMYQSADRFLRTKTNQNLANKLQDDGYDVWIFNARGNKYSRNHSRLNLDDKLEREAYFEYTYHEIGYYDLSATVDYILSTTGLETITYIGHSLGGTFFLVLNSMLPEYNDKFGQAFLMAPLAYQTYFPHKSLIEAIGNADTFYTELKKAEVFEVFPDINLNKNEFTTDECFGAAKYKEICMGLELDILMDLEDARHSKEETRGGSMKTLAHWAQNVQNKKFCPWKSKKDTRNSDKDDIKDPPEYDLNKITVPTEIIFSSTDDMVDERDIDQLVKAMQHATSRKVERRNFHHDEFISGRQVMNYVYNDIIKKLPDPIITTTTTTTTTSTPVAVLKEQLKSDKTTEPDGSSTLLPGFAILIIGLKCQVLMHLRSKMV